MAELDDEIARHALDRRGLRFADVRVEDSYRAWHMRRSVRFTRMGMVMSLVNWCICAIAAVEGATAHLTATLVAIGVMMGVIAAVLASSYRRRWIPWTLPLTAACNALAGCLLASICYFTVDDVELMTGAIAIVGFFGFTIFRLRPGMAFVSAIPYMVLDGVFLTLAERRGAITPATMFLNASSSLAVLFSGVFACAVVERLSRQAFRAERIAELQHAAVERERARADVAERSRELWEQLSRMSSSDITTALLPGSVVADRYRVARALGAGGMGEVYEVERIADHRPFALKILSRSTDRDALMRFAREAEIASRLNHPHVVGVFDVGIAQAGMFLVMELVSDAKTLANAARGDARVVLSLLGQVADALAAMHALGVVHRDLKPANILLADGAAKIADFGIACLRSDIELGLAGTQANPVAGNATQQSIELTPAGAVLGTPLYMAPELVVGARQATSRADVWSFGVIAFELLANRLPFVDTPFIERRAGRPMPAMESFACTGVDAALARLLDRCLATEQQTRPSAQELRDALRTA